MVVVIVRPVSPIRRLTRSPIAAIAQPAAVKRMVARDQRSGCKGPEVRSQRAKPRTQNIIQENGYCSGPRNCH